VQNVVVFVRSLAKLIRDHLEAGAEPAQVDADSLFPAYAPVRIRRDCQMISLMSALSGEGMEDDSKFITETKALRRTYPGDRLHRNGRQYLALFKPLRGFQAIIVRSLSIRQPKDRLPHEPTHCGRAPRRFDNHPSGSSAKLAG
jgi:hypothetical protein